MITVFLAAPAAQYYNMDHNLGRRAALVFLPSLIVKNRCGFPKAHRTRNRNRVKTEQFFGFDIFIQSQKIENIGLVDKGCKTQQLGRIVGGRQ